MATKKTFDALLPATPCVAQMRLGMVERAAAEGISLAEAQRKAFAIFLRQRGKKSNRKDQ